MLSRSRTEGVGSCSRGGTSRDHKTIPISSRYRRRSVSRRQRYLRRRAAMCDPAGGCALGSV